MLPAGWRPVSWQPRRRHLSPRWPPVTTAPPLAELCRRYGKRLVRFGIQHLGNEGLAEEMVQETFVRLWRTAGRFDAENPAWPPTCMSSPAASPATARSTCGVPPTQPNSGSCRSPSSAQATPASTARSSSGVSLEPDMTRSVTGSRQLADRLLIRPTRWAGRRRRSLTCT